MFISGLVAVSHSSHLTGHGSRQSQLGFRKELTDEKNAMDGLAGAVSKVLTGKHNIVKYTILGSLGSDPEEGTTSPLRPGAMNIVDVATVILEKLKVKSVHLDVRLCGRIAVLRQLISENDDNKYWGDVDKNLASVHEKYPDPAQQSRFIKKYVLDPDLKTYGAVDLKSLDTPSAAVAGSSNTSQTATTPIRDDDEE
ncbi:hypothetical protein K438DRAFT_1747377 [Mycena galopus ATCC 62051]|nr:hypothetical protein K438DRAFT_1747377 [Mycena galopus ATCC 62051]